MLQPGFWKNVVTVLAGASGAQALPLLVAPLLTRLCTPAEMGAFSVWLGVIAVMSIVATLRIDTVMVLDLGKRQQRLCFSVVAWAACTVALVLTLAGVQRAADAAPERAVLRGWPLHAIPGLPVHVLAVLAERQWPTKNP